MLDILLSNSDILQAMSIALLTGVPGTGKTYSTVADHILPALTPTPSDNRIRTVYHNVRGMDAFNCAKLIGEDFRAVKRNLKFIGEEVGEVHAFLTHLNKLLLEFGKTKTSTREMDSYFDALIVLDEAHRYFDPKEYQKLAPFKELVSIHRHFGLDFLIVTQNHSDLWNVLKGRVEVTYFLTKSSIFSNKYIQKEYSEVNMAGDCIESVKSYNPNIYVCYQSRQRTDFQELKAKSNPLKQPKVILLFSSGIISLFYLVYIFTYGNPIAKKKREFAKNELTSSSLVFSSSSGLFNQNTLLDNIKNSQGLAIGYKSYSCSGSLCRFTLSDGSIEIIPKLFLKGTENSLAPRLTPIYNTKEEK